MSLRAALQGQAAACAALGSPFSARVLALLADRLEPGDPLADRLFGWPGELGGAGQSVPLRLLGALHALVLSGRDPALAACYPPQAAPDDAALWHAISAALHRHAGFVDRFLDSPPQTNEIGRSAVLIAAGHWLTARTGLPLALLELGASAGLNLWWDRYALRLGPSRYGPADAVLELAPEWRGRLPPLEPPRVLSRRGVDLSPFDLADPDQVLRLRAYVWADQPQRRQRLDRALTLPPAPVDRGDAAGWLAAQLALARPDRLTLVCNTVAWQYFPPATQQACRAALEEAGARLPLAHLQMETDGGTDGAGLTLRLWPQDLSLSLGRADFHGRWLDWRPSDEA